MGISSTIYSTDYIVYGDIITFFICTMVLLLLKMTSSKNYKGHSFLTITFSNLLVTSVASSYYFKMIKTYTEHPVMLIYGFRWVYYFFIIAQFALIAKYFRSLITNEEKRITTIFFRTVFVLFQIANIAMPLLKIGFHIDYGLIYESYTVNLFGFAFLFYGVVYIITLLKSNNKLLVKIRLSLLLSVVCSMCLMFSQSVFHETSLVCAVFLIPMLTNLLLIHNNPFDLETGALDFSSFYQSTEVSGSKQFLLYSFYSAMLETGTDEANVRIYEELVETLNNEIKHGVLFRVSDGRFVVLVDEKNIEKFYSDLDKLNASMMKLVDWFGIDYAVTLVKSDDYLTESKLYKDYILFLEKTATVVESSFDSIEKFKSRRYILSELKDIATKRDLDDPRVVLYCQPVLNIASNTFDSAEVLVRLNLDQGGIYTPDKFIDLAEKYKFIHTLSLIILNKACKQIKRMIDRGIDFKRLSVNFSIVELREQNFCDDIITTINNVGIPFNTIAVELTESRNDTDFEFIKKKIEELKEYGLSFYLDDFGTGYSNFERIMKLPIDIIKFDRSMLLLASSDKGAEFMVKNFSSIFKNLGYTVLFEGIETEADEQSCIDKFAEYLQGYRYSKPIPLTELVSFLESKQAENRIA